jgi:hypothetical protein
MGSFKKRLNVNKLKWYVTFFLIAILTVAMVFAFVKIDKQEKTKTLGSSSFTYSIGLLDEDGGYEQGTTSIYLKNYYSVDGLSVELDDDATVTYKVFFYDSEKEFIESTADLNEDFDSSSTPETAEYFRIMITPTNDPEVSFFEINTYAGQLSVSINK